MSARSFCCAALVALVAFCGLSSQADEVAPGVAIAGQVQHPATLTVRDLQALPVTTVSVSFATDKGQERATYAGALLWSVISNAAPIDAPGKNTKLRHTILVTGRDGYAAALSEGELDPDFAGKQVLLAYEKDGKPISGVRLVVPGDLHGGRAVRDVVRIEVQ